MQIYNYTVRVVQPNGRKIVPLIGLKVRPVPQTTREELKAAAQKLFGNGSIIVEYAFSHVTYLVG